MCPSAQPSAAVRRLWLAQLVSIAGDFLALFAVLSLASFRLHATPAQITGVSISYMLPLALFGPLAGVLADRWNPQHTMVSSDLIRAFLALLLVFATQLTQIYAILFALSAVSTFFIPAQTITIRALVPPQELLALNATLQQAMLITRILSPAVAGALVANAGPASCFYLDVVSFLVSALIISTARFPLPPRQRTQTRAVLTGLATGIRFILAHPAISFVMTAMASATFAISCFSPLIALFVRDILRADTRTFGVISALIAVGMLVGTTLVRRQKLTRPQSLITLSLAVVAAGIFLMGASTLAPITALGACVMGTGVGLLMAPAHTLIQSATPLPLVGRVSSGVISLISLAQIAGLIFSGQFAALLGLRHLFFTSATLLLALALLGARSAPLTQTHAEQTR